MKVILVKNVAKVGNAGDVCEVKDGYAKNYLLPNRLAVAYGDAQGKKILEQVEAGVKKKKEESDKIDEKLRLISGKKIEVKVKVNSKNQLFASVNQDEIKKIVKQNFDVMPDKVVGVPLKSIGTYNLTLEFGGGKRSQIEVVIVAL